METTMEVQELARLLAMDAPVVVLDLRPARERAEWHIPGSLHVDAFDALKHEDPAALAAVDLPSDRLIVTVCGAGKTSLLAAEQLRRRGLRAMSLEGGMRAWSEAFNEARVPLTGTTAEVVQVRRTGKGCLSYVIGAGGEAAVIDASLPPEVYTRLAAARGWRITHVLDTHVHADHLSRSRALADLTGAAFQLPVQRRVSFDYSPVGDGDVFRLGDARLRAMHTPGHTDESTCYLLDDAALFTGDTLFTDGVGRPDLEARPDQLRVRAGALHDSLHRLLRDVPAGAIVLPGHASRPVPFDGIALGEALAAVPGRVQALALPKEAFVEHLLGRIPAAPPHYERIVELNEAGATSVVDLLTLEAGANRCAIT